MLEQIDQQQQALAEMNLRTNKYFDDFENVPTKHTLSNRKF